MYFGDITDKQGGEDGLRGGTSDWGHAQCQSTYLMCSTAFQWKQKGRPDLWWRQGEELRTATTFYANACEDMSVQDSPSNAQNAPGLRSLTKLSQN